MSVLVAVVLGAAGCQADRIFNPRTESPGQPPLTPSELGQFAPDGQTVIAQGDTIGATAPFAYLRLRSETPYDEDALRRWAGVVSEQVRAGRDAYVYLRHDEDGQMGLGALRLRELLAGEGMAV